jgi:hypothetical protein
VNKYQLPRVGILTHRHADGTTWHATSVIVHALNVSVDGKGIALIEETSLPLRVVELSHYVAVQLNEQP